MPTPARRHPEESPLEDDLLLALSGLRAALAAPPLAVPMPTREADVERRDRLVAEVDGHVARVRDLDAPLLAVFGGGSGAGKSTVANSLVGQPVAATGVIRPTTSSPTLLLDPTDADWFTGPGADRILPGYARSKASGRDSVGTQRGRVVHVVTSHAIPPGLAVLDAPDIDSVRSENRTLADELLDAADVWVWFVTPGTYADEEGMRYLRRAARRRTALAVVLNQVHERDAEEIVADLRDKLAAEGLTGVEIHVVPRTALAADRLPDRAITELRRWLRGLADPEARLRWRRQTLEGALDDLAEGIAPLLRAIREEQEEIAALRGEAAAAWDAVPERFTDALEEGPPLRQEVLSRWTTFVGTSRFTDLVESATASVRGWLRKAMDTRTSAEGDRLNRQVQAEVADTVADLAVRVADLAAADTAAAWEDSAVGRSLLTADPGLRRASEGLPARAEEEMIAWQDAVTELIRTKGETRKLKARWASTAINAAATTAILAAFASTGGITGIEAGIAAGAAGANQALLVKLLGEQQVTWILNRAREDLTERIGRLAADEKGRYTRALDAIAPPQDAAESIETALRDVARARG